MLLFVCVDGRARDDVACGLSVDHLKIWTTHFIFPPSSTCLSRDGIPLYMRQLVLKPMLTFGHLSQYLPAISFSVPPYFHHSRNPN